MKELKNILNFGPRPSIVPTIIIFSSFILILFISEIGAQTKANESEPQSSTPKSNSTLPRAKLREICNETLQCVGENVFCNDKGFCRCTEGFVPDPNNLDACKERTIQTPERIGTDPTMIAVIVGLVLMSVTLCVVMRLFAKARFSENRTIFNTPNPRLMNTSLKVSKRGPGGGVEADSKIRASLDSTHSDSIHSPPPLRTSNRKELNKDSSSSTITIKSQNLNPSIELQMEKLSKLEC